MQAPFVSIIIPTYNRPFLLDHCLQRVLAQPYARKEVIVVDSSVNDESEAVIARYPTVLSVRLRGQRDNRPQAKNAGMALASGDIIVFIDDDSMVSTHWLETVVAIHEDDTIGAAGGRVMRKPYPYSEEESGSPHMHVNIWGRVIWEGAELVSSERVDVDHLISCNVSFRREVLEQIGGFDPNYTKTSLGEETDLCLRVKKAGWRIVYEPAMSVTHFSARSSGFYMRRPGVQFSYGRNSTYFAIKQRGLRPITLVGQLIIDPGAYFVKVAGLSSMFMIGALAQMAGRCVGLGVGIMWCLSTERQRKADPKVVMRTRPPQEKLGVSSQHLP